MSQFVFTMKESKSGFSFHLEDGAGGIVGVSEVYTTKAAAENGIASIKKNASIANVEDQVAEEHEASNPKFELYKDKAGEFRFRLKATNGQIILASHPYMSKEACEYAIESVARYAQAAPVQ